MRPRESSANITPAPAAASPAAAPGGIAPSWRPPSSGVMPAPAGMSVLAAQRRPDAFSGAPAARSRGIAAAARPAYIEAAQLGEAVCASRSSKGTPPAGGHVVHRGAQHLLPAPRGLAAVPFSSSLGFFLAFGKNRRAPARPLRPRAIPSPALVLPDPLRGGGAPQGATQFPLSLPFGSYGGRALSERARRPSGAPPRLVGVNRTVSLQQHHR